MERPIDEIKKAEAAMRELVEAAAELRHRVDMACAHNPKETAELLEAAVTFEKEVERIQMYLRQWRQSIQ